MLIILHVILRDIFCFTLIVVMLKMSSIKLKWRINTWLFLMSINAYSLVIPSLLVVVDDFSKEHLNRCWQQWMLLGLDQMILLFSLDMSTQWQIWNFATKQKVPPTRKSLSSQTRSNKDLTLADLQSQPTLEKKKNSMYSWDVEKLPYNKQLVNLIQLKLWRCLESGKILVINLSQRFDKNKKIEIKINIIEFLEL